MREQTVLEPIQMVAFQELWREQGSAGLVVNLARDYLIRDIRRQEEAPISGLEVQLLLR